MSDASEHRMRRQPRNARRGPYPPFAVALGWRRSHVPLVFALGSLAIAACAGSPISVDVQPETSIPQTVIQSPTDMPDTGVGSSEEVDRPAAQAPSPDPAPAAGGAVPPTGTPPEDLARSDSQGAVEVTVIPSAWRSDASGTIEFQVSMNTHSVDLSMDLADSATLQTDTGVTLQALDWSGGSGHHVTGVLRFPSATPEGQPLLEEATQLTLTLRGVDAPSRVFRWDISSLP